MGGTENNARRWNGMSLRLRRVQRGWQMRDVSRGLRLLGIHPAPAASTVMRWEKGSEPSDYQVAVALGRLFGCGAEAFYREPRIE